MEFPHTRGTSGTMETLGHHGVLWQVINVMNDGTITVLNGVPRVICTAPSGFFHTISRFR